MFKFQTNYFIAAIILFFTEVIIALFAHDAFIRPYFGDFLVVILLYCIGKSFINISVIKLSVAVLIFSYIIETLQYFNFVKIIGLENCKIANVILGNSFAWNDIIAYTLGITLVVFIENLRFKKIKNN